MTGVYSQLFLDNFGNIVPTVRALAAAADDMEMKLERLRVHVGFHEDWSPSHDRMVKSASYGTVKWIDKCGSVNGMGDLHALLQEMCAWMDTMGEKVEEVMKATEHSEIEPVHMLGDLPGKPTGIATVSCTKCGKSLNPRGAHFHTKNCKGLAA